MARWSRTSRAEPCALIYANIGFLTQKIRGKRREEHLRKLAVSIKNVVQAAQPDILCMCEVGSYACTTTGALTENEMERVCQTCSDAWKSVTRAQPGCIYEWPHPYLTLYNTNTTEISKAAIVPTFTVSARIQRFAQTLSCAKHDCQPFDVWNIHNPCPSRPNNLTDKQREESLDTILRTSSITDPRKPTTEGSFVLGGDMNMNYEMMCFLMEKLGPPLGLSWCGDRALIERTISKPLHVPTNYSSRTSGCTPEDCPDFCMACKLQSHSIRLEVEFPVEPKAHIPYGILINCEHLPSIHDQEHQRSRRWAQKTKADVEHRVKDPPSDPEYETIVDQLRAQADLVRARWRI